MKALLKWFSDWKALTRMSLCIIFICHLYESFLYVTFVRYLNLFFSCVALMHCPLALPYYVEILHYSFVSPWISHLYIIWIYCTLALPLWVDYLVGRLFHWQITSCKFHHVDFIIGLCYNWCQIVINSLVSLTKLWNMRRSC